MKFYYDKLKYGLPEYNINFHRKGIVIYFGMNSFRIYWRG